MSLPYLWCFVIGAGTVDGAGASDCGLGVGRLGVLLFCMVGGLAWDGTLVDGVVEGEGEGDIRLLLVLVLCLVLLLVLVGGALGRDGGGGLVVFCDGRRGGWLCRRRGGRCALLVGRRRCCCCYLGGMEVCWWWVLVELRCSCDIVLVV